MTALARSPDSSVPDEPLTSAKGVWGAACPGLGRPSVRHEPFRNANSLTQLTNPNGTQMNDNHALRARAVQLSRTGRSARQISKILQDEGFKAGSSRASVDRMLRGERGPIRSPRAAQTAQRTQPAPVSQPPAAELAEPELYVPDDDAIDAHVDAIAEFIDRRVDAAVAAELADAATLKDRLQNRGGAAGWPVCLSCGLHVPPNEGRS